MKTLFVSKLHVLGLVILISMSNCESDLKDVPSCVNDKINEIRSQKLRNPPGSVWQYKYNGQTVYFIPRYCCDIPSVLLDETCNLICNPDGGLTGNGDGKCPDFFTARTEEKQIWTDDRK